jgi:DNA polymerase-4
MPKLATFRAKHSEPRDESSAPARTSTPILHLDMDAFFVSVELLERPDLRGKPVIVGGRPDQRSVVSAASYEARAFGVHSAMPLRTAAKLCPHAVFLDCRHALYEQWSDKVAAILGKYSPIVEMASIDEAYLDLSGTERLHGPPLAAAHSLLRDITDTTGLPCSGGLAATRLVAKVASDQAKPRGLLWVPEGAEENFLAPLGVRRIPGIGRVTEAALRGLAIETVGQLAAVPLEKLKTSFGLWGSALYRKARGEDAFEFFLDAEPKSISHNHTFSEDVSDADAETLRTMLSHLCQKAAKRLRDAGLSARTVTLTIRYQSFRTTTHSRTFSEPTDLDTIILAAIRELFEARWDRRQKVRLVGVALTGFSHGALQLDLLEGERRQKLEKLARAADHLRDRFGFEKIQYGGSLGQKGRGSGSREV